MAFPSSPTNGQKHTEGGVTYTYNSTYGVWDIFDPNQTLNASDVLTAIKTVDGAGSGLDADLLDGLTSASFLRRDVTNDIFPGTNARLNFENISNNFPRMAFYKLAFYEWGSSRDLLILDGGRVRVDAEIDASRGLFHRRHENAHSGTSWYSPSYTAWCDYMSPAGQTGSGPTGNVTAPSGSLVTSWGLRSFIENASGYGWTFESGTSTQTTPVVKFEIRSSDGSAYSHGSITAAGDFITNSDIRLKSDIKPIDNALQIVMSLDGKAYVKDNKAGIGFIAQEVEEVLPMMVHTADDEMGTKSVNYANMVAILVEAIKEQQKQIDELKEKLNGNS